MTNKVTFLMNRLREQLWFKPLLFCLLSIVGALLAHLTDDTELYKYVPEIETKSIEELLSTLSASMLVISIFAVGSMISAFNAASNTATPRSFKLIISDDVSQFALSVFIGSFIYSVVADVALKNGYYGKSGHFTLFILTVGTFALVIITFLRWVASISNLGRLGHTINKIEEATSQSIDSFYAAPYLGGVPYTSQSLLEIPMYSKNIAYVHQIFLDQLQEIAEANNILIRLNCLPGTFITPDRPIVYLIGEQTDELKFRMEDIENAFRFGNTRIFDVDPRFGFITLSEIASRALSPAVNDPGTAIAILGSHMRLFALWIEATDKKEKVTPKYNRIEVPTISPQDLFDDAFRPIARDGANNIEVMLRIQKVLTSIHALGNNTCKSIVEEHSKLAFKRAEECLILKEDLDLLKASAKLV